MDYQTWRLGGRAPGLGPWSLGEAGSWLAPGLRAPGEAGPAAVGETANWNPLLLPGKARAGVMLTGTGSKSFLLLAPRCEVVSEGRGQVAL